MTSEEHSATGSALDEPAATAGALPARHRVVQWATGGVGRAAIQAVRDHPELDLVACWVHSSDKVGVDAGVIAGIEALGVPATDDVEAILALDADCVVYAPLLPDPAEVARLLRSGKNVVTPVGWFHRSPGDEALEEAAREGGSTLHGTGIDPGGISDVFPLMLSAMSSATTFVRAEEFSDIRSYNAPDVVRQIMCFGGTPEAAMEGPMLGLLTGGFAQSIRLILDGMGFDPSAEIRTSQQVAVATEPIDSPAGVIEPGQVAGQRFCWEAVIDDQPVVRVAVNWLMGTEHLDPAWTLGAAGERYEIEVQGDPDLFVTLKGMQPETPEAGWERNPGVVATANHCVNSIPYVVRAYPGIRTYLDLPVIAGRAHPRFARRS
ncbi:dihydrodipicolinate reductase [Nocardioides pocheonensis]|uniref:Dihydrodipicolinate reductase n=1 Tax=Nocardioides pocheonensis TaxID=661485 RepID=A0A3N0GNA8_9ACTN|nr:dihydrodipicolinate reductase [Nocardioides pocheonensis]RNM13965.1 dihydrodipicolinate reductase [Nocardioides pocheonensis]